MNDNWCLCLAKEFFDNPPNSWITFFEFPLTLLIIVSGVFLNYKFWKKLEHEKKNRPLGRKGNIIEPIVRWFCIIQIIYWPIQLLLIWSLLNNVIPLSIVPAWVCTTSTLLLFIGRSIISYNSLFVAFIRYLYIVHDRKANQWDFETVGHRFQIASLSVPILHVLIFISTFDLPSYSHFSTETSQCETLTPMMVMLTSQYFPKPLIDVVGLIMLATLLAVCLNLVEAFLYIKIFRKIKRYFYAQ